MFTRINIINNVINHGKQMVEGRKTSDKKDMHV